MTLTIWLTKITLTLAMGWIVWLLAVRANPRWRVLALRCTVLALVALPLAAFFAPRIEMGVQAPTVPAFVSMPEILRTPINLTNNPLPVETTPQGTPIAVSSAPPVKSVHVPAWTLILPAAYLFVLTILFLRLVAGYVAMWRVGRQAISVEDGIQSEFNDVMAELGTNRRARIALVEGLSTPMLTGLLCPVLLLPKRMLDPAYRQELRGVFLHEGCHLKNLDLWWNLALHLTTAALWFHPLAWRMGRAHSAACEAVSDAVAAEHWGSSERYSRLLARVAVELVSNPSTRAGIPMARVSEVSRRLAILAKGTRAHPLGRRVILAVAIPAFALSAALSALRPAEANSAAPVREIDEAQVVDGTELQAALDDPNGPALIQLSEGVYTKPIVISRDVELIGMGADKTSFRMLADEPAILVEGASHVTITNLSVVWGIKSTDAKIANPAGIFAKDCEKLVITGVHLEPYDRPLDTPSGLTVAGRTHMTFANGSATGFAYAIVYTDGAEGGVVESVLLGAGHSEITQHENTKVVIERNILGECGYHAVRNSGGTMAMKNNIVFNNVRAGAYLGNKPAKGLIEGNLFTGSKGEIWSYYTSNVDIRENFFVNSKGAAIGAWKSCTHLVENNVFLGNPTAIRVYEKDSGGKITLRDNRYSENGKLFENLEGEASPQMIASNWGSRKADFDADAVGSTMAKSSQVIRDLYATHRELLEGKLNLWKPEEPTDSNADLSAVSPRIVSTVPPIGASDVYTGLEAIEVTFDQDMQQGMSWTGGGPNFPPLAKGGKPHWKDARTCVFPTALVAGKYYRVGINWGERFSNFRSLHGMPVETTALYFTTEGATAEELVKTIRPTIVSLDPPNGATNLDPSIQELSVTFNIQMSGDYSFTETGGNYPRNAPENPVRWSDDGKTCTLAVALEPNSDYELGINGFMFKNFTSVSGIPVEPVVWKFSTGPAK